MTMTMKKIILFLAAGLMAFSSCDDWTEVESLDISVATLESENSSLYNAYLEAVRAYKETDHQVTIAKFDNVSDTPSGRAEHLTTLPDSVDYIVLYNGGEVSDENYEEMTTVREDYGTKVLYEINYSTLVSEYKAYAEAGGTTEQNSYISSAVSTAVGYYSTYGYDGICVVYEGANPESCNDDALSELEDEQTAFFASIATWRTSNSSAVLLLEGTPQYILNYDSLVSSADYYIVPCESAQTYYELSYLVNLVTNYDSSFPTDRFVVGVTTVSLTDTDSTDGYFASTDEDGEEITAIVGAASWAVQTSSSYTRAGISVANAQVDYYNSSKIFPNIREAISIMNPTPLN